MAIDTDIRDQAYQFFIQEAPELLELIEQELLTLRQERSTGKVHNMMRAAHSIKGGAASVGLETIKTLAHSLEDIFKALFNEELEIDTQLESLLLHAYDCLRLPLIEQITTGQFDSDKAMAQAEPVFAEISTLLGDFLGGPADLPSSIELGVDIALSIFEVDVTQGLDSLRGVLAAPQGKAVAGELRAQAEVFSGIAELLNLPGFGAIAKAAIAALDAHPAQALQITELAVADFQAAVQAVIAGDRTTGGAPSTALASLANLEVDAPDVNIVTAPGHISEVELLEDSARSVGDAVDTAIFSLDDVFGDFALSDEPAALEPDKVETVDEDSNQELNQQIFNPELVEQAHISPVADEELRTIPTLDDVFGDFALAAEPAAQQPSPPPTVQPSLAQPQELRKDTDDSAAIVPAAARLPAVPEKAAIVSTPTKPAALQKKPEGTAAPTAPTPGLSVRVDLDRLEAMNNLVGELSINRNSLSLQNEQLQRTIQELLRRFAKFQQMGHSLRALSDKMLVAPERYSSWMPRSTGRIRGLSATNDVSSSLPTDRGSFSTADFDSLEMDSYGELHSVLSATLEEIVQLEETVGDVVLVAGQSSQTLEGQRQMLSHLRDDLMWARMLPLGEVLNRFPRMMRDLSTSYEKPVDLKLSGTGVLVDKAALDKLHDPLMHLLRNAFDHGIELPDVRRQQGKPERGLIEIRAYHQGSQTIIEVRDDGRGFNLERIKSRALDMGLLSPEQVAAAPTSRLLELVFEPGFSTASQVSELSGRGVGLDVVRSQMRSLKGTVTVTSSAGQGTTFTLRIPLTLTIAKLLVCFVGSTAFALPSDSIEEILIPKPNQIKHSVGQRYLHWGDRIVPAHHLSELVKYACPLPEAASSGALVAASYPEDWAPPMLLLSQDEQFIALEIDRLVTEQELVIKTFGAAIAPPSYIYGCTILGDGSLVPVIDGAALLNSFMGQRKTQTFTTSLSETPTSALNEDESNSSIPALPIQRNITPTLLVVDDSITVRQTLALTFEKAGYRVLQARDGREAIEKLQQNSSIIQLVVCDIEMPNMNGFEFLSQRRTDPQLLKIPTVMLTSRSSDKHRQLAMHLGANGYFTKPYIEQEFLAAIKATIMPSAPVAVPALAHAR